MASRQYGLVSVILPAYNEARFIREALESILEQTYSHLEVIVVDDGSTDNTADIVREIAARDSRVLLIRQPNQGVGVARNTGIARALGMYIAPIDADDRWSPLKLEKQVARLEERGPATAMVYCWYRSMDADGMVLGYSQPYEIEGRIGRAMLLRNLVGNASVPLFRSSCIQKVGGYLSRAEQGGAQGFEDWDLSLRLSEQYEVGVVQDYLVDYRQTPNCMSTNAQGMANSFNAVINRARERNPDIPPHQFRWSTGNFYYYMTRKSFVWYRYRESMSCLARAVVADPLHLLNLQVYRMAGRSLLYALSGGRLHHSKRMDRPIRSSEGPARSTAMKYENSPIGQRTFGRIQAKRWSAILTDIDMSCI